MNKKIKQATNTLKKKEKRPRPYKGKKRFIFPDKVCSECKLGLRD